MAPVQELEGLEWPELVTALDIDRNDPTVYRIDRLVIRTYYQSDVGLVGISPTEGEQNDYVFVDQPDEGLAASGLPTSFASNKAPVKRRKQQHRRPGAIHEGGQASAWQQAYDTAAGCYYYYNMETQVSQWEEPEEGYIPSNEVWDAEQVQQEQEQLHQQVQAVQEQVQQHVAQKELPRGESPAPALNTEASFAAALTASELELRMLQQQQQQQQQSHRHQQQALPAAALTVSQLEQTRHQQRGQQGAPSLRVHPDASQVTGPSMQSMPTCQLLEEAAMRLQQQGIKDPLHQQQPAQQQQQQQEVRMESTGMLPKGLLSGPAAQHLRFDSSEPSGASGAPGATAGEQDDATSEVSMHTAMSEALTNRSMSSLSAGRAGSGATLASLLSAGSQSLARANSNLSMISSTYHSVTDLSAHSSAEQQRQQLTPFASASSVAAPAAPLGKAGTSLLAMLQARGPAQLPQQAAGAAEAPEQAAARQLSVAEGATPASDVAPQAAVASAAAGAAVAPAEPTPPAGMPPGPFPAGAPPAAGIPMGPFPMGPFPPGPLPPGALPPGPMPHGPMPYGPMPYGPLPLGPLPPGWPPAGLPPDAMLPPGMLPGPMPPHPMGHPWLHPFTPPGPLPPHLQHFPPHPAAASPPTAQPPLPAQAAGAHLLAMLGGAGAGKAQPAGPAAEQAAAGPEAAAPAPQAPAAGAGASLLSMLQRAGSAVQPGSAPEPAAPAAPAAPTAPTAAPAPAPAAAPQQPTQPGSSLLAMLQQPKPQQQHLEPPAAQQQEQQQQRQPALPASPFAQAAAAPVSLQPPAPTMGSNLLAMLQQRQSSTQQQAAAATTPAPAAAGAAGPGAAAAAAEAAEAAPAPQPPASGAHLLSMLQGKATAAPTAAAAAAASPARSTRAPPPGFAHVQPVPRGPLTLDAAELQVTHQQHMLLDATQQQQQQQQQQQDAAGASQTSQVATPRPATPPLANSTTTAPKQQHQQPHTSAASTPAKPQQSTMPRSNSHAHKANASTSNGTAVASGTGSQGVPKLEPTAAAHLRKALPRKLAKYWLQRYSLVSRFDMGVQLDSEGWWSVTPEVIAYHQALRARCGVMVDAFAGCGGNAIQFALTCNHVIAIEINPARLEMARHNARLYGVEHKISFICADFFKVAPFIKCDGVFLSPPWGGPTYKWCNYVDVFQELESISMNLPRLLAICQAMVDPVRGRGVVWFMPRNLHLGQLSQLVPGEGSWEVERNVLNDHFKGISIYCGRFKSANYTEHPELKGGPWDKE